MLTRRHSSIVRVTHWVNVIAVFVMVGSGLRIFNAYPRFAPRGGTFCCYPFEGQPMPDWMTFGRWLGGARHWHFAMMWVLVVNGILYLTYIYLHGEWRDLTPRRGDARSAWEMIKFYVFVRRDHPEQGKHNALQRATYFSFPIIGFVLVVTGLAIWKPVQLSLLTNLLGGFAWARYWHFVATWLLVLLSIIHVFMVFTVDPQSLRAMITGYYNPDKSPERRNARPFYRSAPPEVHDGSPKIPAD